MEVSDVSPKGFCKFREEEAPWELIREIVKESSAEFYSIAVHIHAQASITFWHRLDMANMCKVQRNNLPHWGYTTLTNLFMYCKMGFILKSILKFKTSYVMYNFIIYFSTMKQFKG